jgi:hypothetical protein
MNEEVKAGEWIGKHLFAFPANHYDLADSEHGMTLRDYFAAKAMQAMLENSECPLAPLTEIPQACYKMADAMLKARQA